MARSPEFIVRRAIARFELTLLFGETERAFEVACVRDARNLRLHDRKEETPTMESRPPLPPFTRETALLKVRAAEDGWNTCNPARVALAYTLDSRWRNRDEFIRGRPAIVEFLTRKWKREADYRLIKELWSFTDDRIAVRFAYEWHDVHNNWFRSYGNENWEFDPAGLMQVRHASINDLAIREEDRLYYWDRSEARPADHKGLSDFGL